MEKNNVFKLNLAGAVICPLTQMLRTGVRELIQAAVQGELQEFMAQHESRRLGNSLAAVVRNCRHPEREIKTVIGPVTIQVPKVQAKDGQPVTFRSALVPPYVRKSQSLDAAQPWLYLKGISSGEMQSAMQALLGPKAAGLSASTVARLKQVLAEEYEQFRQAGLDSDQWVYI